MKKYFILFVSVLALIFASCKSAPKEKVEDSTAETTPQAQEQPQVSESKETAPAKDLTAENKRKFEKLLKARQAAIDAGAPKILTKNFDETEAAYNGRKDYISKNLSDASVSAEIDELTARYEILANVSEAYAKKTRIDELDLSQYDKPNYAAGEAAYKKFLEQYDGGKGYKDLLATAKAGNAAYSKVLTSGLKQIAAKARTSALDAKKKADSVYAGVAEKTIYKSCADKIVKADSKLVTGDPEAAYNGYNDARNSFMALYESVSKKRAAAQAQIDKARQAIENARQYAAEADASAPLEGKVEGIEDEGTTLLEADTYKNPDEAAINLDVTETGKAAAAIESAATQGGAQ
ncbi:hypothetical protein HRQ91_02115 [Treponema parvum]|uniref:Lipoprotein n=1 Tax=Treponema parvum TaxID=138851 RepID=A0A975F2I0_9SPIR|nr:hypothetical protein [Treponema parvum]QTQ13346.1 hypothetical protein HRQ91_02115 [Treponema parvum]